MRRTETNQVDFRNASKADQMELRVIVDKAHQDEIGDIRVWTRASIRGS